MCWISKEIPVMRTAQEDIHVIKILKEMDKGFVAYYHNDFVYKLYEPISNKNFSSVIQYDSFFHRFEVNEGFHSYHPNIQYILDGILLKVYYDNCFLDRYIREGILVIADGIIPKGSLFLLNKYGEYVSNKIEIVGIKENVLAR